MCIQTLIEEALREMHPGGILICGVSRGGNKIIPWHEEDMPVGRGLLSAHWRREGRSNA